ncbi:MAG: hypothetical protein AAB784_00190 [Patescibacteria group bacterium]
MTLKAFVNDSTLPQEDKNLWFSILENLDEQQTRIFEDFINNDQDKLAFLTNNIKSKKKAFENNNQDDLDKILSEEASF